jgi:predicted restriction endonuclease
MALCRMCHWTFDEGLLGVSQAYEVIDPGNSTPSITSPAT